MSQEFNNTFRNEPMKAREIFTVVAGFLILSAVLIGILSDWRPSQNMPLGPDSAFMLWCLKWWPHSLFSGHNPFHGNFFYPQGQNLAWVTAIPTLALLTAPITLCLGPVFCYNFITVAALSANGILAYLIARELDCRKIPAVICAVLFYFSSYTWSQLLGHLNLYVTVFAISAIYLAIRHCFSGKSRVRYVILMSSLLALQFGISNEVYTTLIVFMGAALLIIFLMSPRSAISFQKISNFGLDLAASVLLSALWMSPYIYQIFAHRVSGLQPMSSYVADPLNFVIPTQTNWILGEWFKGVSSTFIGNLSEQGVYLGLPILVLLSIAGISFYRRLLNRYLLVLLVAIVIFSLGPQLTIAGVATIPLPWSLAEKLPLLKEALPIRFGLYTSLLASLLVGRLLTEVDTFFFKAMSGLALLMALPNMAMHKMSPVPSDPFFTNGTYLRVIPANASVLILPSYGFWGYQPALWQEESNFYLNIVNGLAGKIPASLTQYEWYYYGGTEPDAARLGLLNFIKHAGVQYILSDTSADDPLLQIYRNLDLPYTSYGRIRLTKISPDIRDHLLLTEQSKQQRHFCTFLVRLSHYGFDYKDGGKNLAKLTPSVIKDANFVRDFGEPLPAASPAANWTNKGYWLGASGTQVAVGFSPVDPETANALYQAFKASADQIYYPYPNVFHGKGTPSSIGQFLAVLKSNGQSSSVHCGR